MLATSNNNHSKTTPAPTLCHHRLLGELLIDGGFVTPLEVECALKAQKKSGEKLGHILVNSGRLSETTLKATLHLQSLLEKEHKPGSAFYRLLHQAPKPELGSGAKPRIRLGELLVAEGEITSEQLESALLKCQDCDTPLGDLLIEAGWLDSNKLGFYLDLQHGLAATLTIAVAAIGIQIHSLAKQHMTNQPSSAPTIHTPAERPRQLIVSHNGQLQDQRWTSISTSKHKDIMMRRQKLKADWQNRRTASLNKAYDKRLVLHTTGHSSSTDLHNAVARHSDEFALQRELVYAIIQTESAYNPNAISRANAYGLMQVVPSTAGLEVHQMLKGINHKPSPKTLLDPQSNIYFGTAYLRILQDVYFHNVEDPEVRTGLTIAAYNMGPSRLVTLLKRQGVPKDITALRNLLERHAPQETQDYFDRVLQRRARLNMLTNRATLPQAA